MNIAVLLLILNIATMAGDLPSFQPDSYTIGEYIRKLENYMLTHHGLCSDERKLAAIETAIGEEGEKVIRNFTEHQRSTYEELTKALREHFKIRNLTFVERNTFFMMYMEEGESVDHYHTRLRAQAKKCDFRIVCKHEVPAQEAVGSTEAIQFQPAVYHMLTDEFIRDRLIVTINDTVTKQRLLQEKHELTLNDTLQIIRAAEEAGRDMRRLIEERSASHKTVNEIRAAKVPGPPAPANKPQRRGDQESYLCTKYCGQRHVRGKCPAYGQTCKSCGRKHHFDKVCRAAGAGRVNAVVRDYQTPVETTASGARIWGPDSGPQYSERDCGLFLGMVEMESQVISEIGVEWAEKIELSNRLVDCKIDTGAQANVMALSTFRQNFGPELLEKSTVNLKAYNNTQIPCVGKIGLHARFNSVSRNVQFYIVPIEAKTILGLQSCVDLGIVSSSSDKTDKGHASVSECVRQTDTTGQEREKSGESLNPLFTGKLREEYAEVFDDSTLGCIKGEPYSIRLKQDAVPAVHAARVTPHAILGKVTAELNRMEKLGVIAKIDEPTDWVNSMVVVQRADKTRICLDPTSLNKFIQREHVILPNTDEMLAKIGAAEIFSKLDLKDGYWQVPLSKEASKLTTFNSPIGRFRYTRLPFGLCSANEVFQKRVSQHVEGIRGAIVLFDDILIFAKEEEEHNRILNQVLRRCQDAGMKLNSKKCKLGVKEVKYLGHIISAKGIHADPEKLEDLLKMPTPQDRNGAQRLLGSLTYLAKFIPNLSTITHPIRQLLVKNVEYMWTHEQDTAMKKIKECLTSAPVLAFYNVEDDVTVSCDASGTGLGACLMQNGKPVSYASRSLTEIERSYAQIEKEMLAIVFACERFYQYIFGKRVYIQTDHQPLATVFQRPFTSNPVRLQRFLIRLQRYDLEVSFVPGKYIPIADMLSRAHTDKDATDDQLELETDCNLLISAVLSRTNCSVGMMERLKIETSKDIALTTVKEYIVNGWPTDMSNCQLSAKVYWSDRASLAYQDGLVIFQDRIVIPKALQAELLSRIHESHQGQDRCKSLARRSVYWKNMNSDIERMVSECNECLLRRKAPAREPLIPHELPDRPWCKLACDVFTYAGIKYQLVVDYYSKWVEVKRFSGIPTSKDVIDHLKAVFSHFGIPEQLNSDGDSIYTSWEFTQFCREYDFKHVMSSAHNPRSNGQAERKIQFIKDMIAKAKPENLNDILLSYRSTPLGPTLGSPAELLMGRNLRNKIPALQYSLTAPEVEQGTADSLKQGQDRMKYYHDRTARESSRVYEPGDLVRYRDNSREQWAKEGQITRRVNSRSFEFVNSKGNMLRRNNRLLQPDRTTKELSVELPGHNPCVNAPPRKSHPLPQPDPSPTLSHPKPQLRQLELDPPVLPRRSERIRQRELRSQLAN